MIARFRVLLPYFLDIPCYDKLNDVELQFGEYKLKLYAPMRANVDASVFEINSDIPIIDAISNLEAEKIVTATSAIKINEQEVVQANLLQIDLQAERDFDRRQGNMLLDPPLELLFNLANSVISRIRSIGRLPHVKPISPDLVGWKVNYLDDNCQPLRRDEFLLRTKFQSKMRWQVSGLTGDIWELVFKLPTEFSPYIWDTLILDAKAQLPDVSTSIVLANAALESLINISLEILAKESKISEESWNWIISRDENWLKQPSAKEKYDQVLYLLTGHSLKEEQKELWKAFDELRSVRNSIVHQGRAILIRKTNKKKEALTLKSILKWQQKWLPMLRK